MHKRKPMRFWCLGAANAQLTCVIGRGRFEYGKVAPVMFWGFSTDPHMLVHNNPVVPFYQASFSISGVEPQSWFSGIKMHF